MTAGVSRCCFQNMYCFFRASPVSQQWRIHLQCRRCRRRGFDPWVWKISWSRKWQPTPVFLPGKSHGWRIMAAYRPWGAKSQTWLSNWTHTCCFLWEKGTHGFHYIFKVCDPNAGHVADQITHKQNPHDFISLSPDESSNLEWKIYLLDLSQQHTDNDYSLINPSLCTQLCRKHFLIH